MTGSMEIGQTVPDGSTEQWKDKKRYLWLWGGLMVPGFGGVLFALAYIATGGWWGGFTLVAPFLVNFLIPLLDLAMGTDQSNPPDEVIEELENDKYYRWVVFAYVPMMFALVFAGYYIIGEGNPVAWVLNHVGLGDWGDAHLSANLMADHLELPWWEKALWALSIAGVVGIGINTAHELGHKKESVERWLAKITLAPTFYGHFYIEHNRGHHVRVATPPEDPASSRLGESLYRFWPRTVWGLAEELVGGRGQALPPQGHPPVPHRQRRPQRLGHVGRLWAAVIALNGWQVAVYIPITVVFGFSLLEVVNYLEHYGLKRQRVGEKQRYERVLPMHSWNSNNIVTNIFLYHLQRHSDHHANPTRRYQALRDFKESPGPADRLRRHDQPRADPAAVAQGDGPPRGRAPRRRRHPGQHRARQGGEVPREVPAAGRAQPEDRRPLRAEVRGRGARRQVPPAAPTSTRSPPATSTRLRRRYGVERHPGRLVLS